MGQLVRSARGELIDFELLAIKQQLASAPVPKAVEQRKQAIDLKDGVKTDVVPDVDFLAVSNEAAIQSGQAKQLNRK
jgi:hypothetical protein